MQSNQSTSNYVKKTGHTASYSLLAKELFDKYSPSLLGLLAMSPHNLSVAIRKAEGTLFLCLNALSQGKETLTKREVTDYQISDAVFI